MALSELSGTALPVSLPEAEHSTRVLRDRSVATLIPAYAALTKPRVMSLLLFTTLAASLIAARQEAIPTSSVWRILIATMVGGALAAGGAAALNCYIDRDIDRVMTRTRRRALPAGLLSPREVLIFGLTLSGLSVVVFATLTTFAAAGLALAGNIFYVVVYTMW